jgi:thioredoxin reductase (NADPH)
MSTMGVITPTSHNASMLVRRWTETAAPAVVALCAAWCDTCNEFRATLERIAELRPDTLFLWLDVEDDSDVCGDIDIENFPTLAIYRGGLLLHYGVTLPLEGPVSRLVDEIRARPDSAGSAPPPVLELPQRLRAHVPAAGA